MMETNKKNMEVFHDICLESLSITRLYEKAEELETIGYSVVGNGAIFDKGIYKLQMRKLMNIKEIDIEKYKIKQLILSACVFACIIFLSFICGFIFGFYRA